MRASRPSRGFTLIEMLVAIGVMALNVSLISALRNTNPKHS
jgi:prepilin-type N-terminal cleavage/methylation domain-containing protein